MMLAILLLAATIATDSIPSPLTVAKWAAHYDMELVGNVQQWSSSMPVEGTPVKWMEWRIVFRQEWPEIDPEACGRLGLKSVVRFWAQDMPFTVDVRGVDGGGVVGPWSEVSESNARPTD